MAWRVELSRAGVRLTGVLAYSAAIAIAIAIQVYYFVSLTMDRHIQLACLHARISLRSALIFALARVYSSISTRMLHKMC